MATIALRAIAIVVLCSAAFAADATTATTDECTALEKQYDGASKTSINPNKLKKSQSQRAHGADLCAQGKPDAGVKALKSALKDIGIEPAS